MTLRIQRSAEGQTVVFTLTGRIQADQVPELEELLRPESRCALDLKDVTLVDRDAVRFLARQEADGMELKNCSAFIREWISLERKWDATTQEQSVAKLSGVKE